MLSPSAAARIRAILDTVPDPEIPAVSITDLGIVRGIEADPPTVVVTPTYTGCPATRAIEQAIRDTLDKAGFGAVAIETRLAPAWSTDWITERGRARLRACGIAPPPQGSTSARLRANDEAECPRCGSRRTKEVSRFGSTPCKALWQCTVCLEPFDRFKCH